MTIETAIAARVSRRSYLPAPLTAAERARLSGRIAACNRAGGVRIVLVEDGAAVFSRFGKSYGLFSGVHTFLAMIGTASDPHIREKLGYFGELVVLEATDMGLGTCWVGGTFDRAACPCPLAADEMLACVIALGTCPPARGVKEAIIYRFMRRGTKTLEDFYDADLPVPAWFKEGLQSVRLAPSAFNAQPVRLQYTGGTASASVSDTEQHRALDLGIAKAHFALTAGGRWDWGNHAALHKAPRGHYGMEVRPALDNLLAAQGEACAAE